MSLTAKKIISSGFFLAFAWGLCAQFKFDKAILVNKETGLPANGPRAICKGEDGFIWIGGSEGLSRFDGSEVKVFREGENLQTSLFDKNIYALLSVKDEVWIGTHQGLSVLNTKTYKFRHYQLTDQGKTDSLKRRFDQYVACLFKDRSGKIWIGTRERGVCMYDEKKDDFLFFDVPRTQYPPLFPSIAPDHSTLSFEESKKNDSIIWAGTTAGLKEINKYTGDVRVYTYPREDKDYQIALNAFRRLYSHDDGLLYVGSWGAGVNVFDPATKTFTPLPMKNPEGKKMLNSVIGGITRKSNHEFWISAGDGILLYDSDLKDAVWYKHNNPVDYEFYGVHLTDESNRAWYMNINGVNYFDPAMQQFATYSFKHLSPREWSFAFYILPGKNPDEITVCPRFSDGLYRFNKRNQVWRKVLFPRNKTFTSERDVVRGFVQLPSGEYVISCDRGIFIYSEKKNRMSTLEDLLPIGGPTRRGAILADRSGNLWLSDDKLGLVRWKPGTKQFRVYKNMLSTTDVGSIYRLENLFEDSHGNIWFQSVNGFGVYLFKKDSLLNFMYSENQTNSFPVISAFAEDRKGRVWASGGDGWLGYALAGEPEKGLVYKFNIREKGMSGNFPKLAADAHGDVWGYTSKELVKINSDDLSFSTYSFQYGVDGDNFFHFSFLPGGEMVFGGRNDITIADPVELKRNTEIPVPYFTEIMVMNKPYDIALAGSPVRLRYKQNFFSIGFSAIAFTMAKDVKFRYRLEGFDDWTEVTGRRFANYTNVPGGDYVFQLQAANNEGIWNEKILEWPIYIATPFWLTWWFRIGFLMLVGFGIYSWYRYRINQVRKKQQLKSEYDKKLANVEMTALLAQMNPHFLFNSLNSIDSYIIRNESKKASEYLNNFARLMRLILQNSRSNYISLKDELEALELYLQMESLRFRDKFSYSIDVDEKLDVNSIVIPPMLVQPYVENAIWHGLMHKPNGDGNVKLNISKNEEELVCVIQDNGIGRKKAAELKAARHSNHKRSMGMQITQDRIEIINKLYSINASVHIHDLENENGEAEGTRVVLTIPV